MERLVRAAVEVHGRDAPPKSAPVLEVYELTASDADEIISVLQTLLPDARLAVDPKTGRLIALGAPAQQATLTVSKTHDTAPQKTRPFIGFPLLELGSST